jgi:O-antigen/teichoic acid export membrane protein
MIGSPWILGIADQVVLSAGSFLIGLIVARGCSQVEFGLFSLGSTITFLLLDIQASLISTPQAIRSAGLEGQALKTFTGSTLIHQLVISVLCAGLLGTVAAILFTLQIGLTGLPPVLSAIALFAVFTLLREYWRRLFILKGLMGRVFVFDGGIALTQVAALVMITHLGIASAAIAHAAIGLVCTGFALLLLPILRHHYKIQWRSIWPDFMSNFMIGGWLLLNSVFWSLGLYAYPWLLATILGPQDTGIWAACMGIIAIISIPLVGILNVLTPRIANAQAEGGVVALRRYVHKSCINYAAFMSVLAVIPIFFGEMLITVIYGSNYGGNFLIIDILALNTVFGAVTGCFGRGLMVIGRANWDFAFNVGTLFIVFTFGWWSITVYGPLGAAVGLTTASGLTALFRFAAFELITRRMLLVPSPT